MATGCEVCLNSLPLGITGCEADPENSDVETAVKFATAKALEFKTKVTGRVLALSALPVGCAFLLFFFGLDAARKFSPNDPARIPFAGIPLLIAVILVSVVGITLNHFLRREVTIEDDFLVYKDPKTELHLEISKLAYSPPGEGFLRMIMFSDGDTFVQLPALFMDEKAFTELATILTRNRRKGRDSRDTYSL